MVVLAASDTAAWLLATTVVTFACGCTVLPMGLSIARQRA